MGDEKRLGISVLGHKNPYLDVIFFSLNFVTLLCCAADIIQSSPD